MRTEDIAACREIESTRFLNEKDRWSEGDWKRYSQGEYLSYVLEEQGNIVGYVVAENEETGIHIRNIAVSEDGQGYGAQLLKAVLPQTGLIYLQVRIDNPATGFYLANGFKETGRTPAFIYMERASTGNPEESS